jgi:hypothetical protein
MSSAKRIFRMLNDRNSVFFAVGVVAVCLLYFVLEWNNGRAQMADFRVYYDAASALVDGGQVYGKAFGVSSGFYKYSPLACVPFIPFTWLAYKKASVVYYVLLSITIALFSLRVADELSAKSNVHKRTWLLALLTGFFLIDHLERELHLGNINLFLLVMLYACYNFWSSHRYWMAGVMLGAVLLFKPHFVILLPYFIWKKQFKSLLTAGLTVLMGLSLPSIFLGFTGNSKLLFKWLGAMQDHNLALQKSPNTIYGLINFSCFNGHVGAWLIAVTLVLVGFFFVYFIVLNDRIATNQTWTRKPRFIEFFVLVALVPNLVHTDTEHFLWTWPLIAYSISQLLFDASVKKKAWYIAILALAFIPYAVNSPDLVGKKVRLLFDEGLLGLSNLILIIIAVTLSLTNKPMHQSED